MRYVNRFTAILACAAGATAFAGAAQAQQSDDALSEYLSNLDQHWSVLEEYCISCHNFTEFAGDLALDIRYPDSANAIPDESGLWETVVRKLRGNLMPPAGEPRPNLAQTQSLIDWLEGYLDAAIELNPQPGYVALHRLNRTEFANEVLRVLNLNITGAPVRGIPTSSLSVNNLLSADLGANGFDNIASLLAVSPGYLEEVVLAARQIARAAIGQREAASQSVTYMGGASPHYVGGMPLGTLGGATWEHYFAVPGEYQIDASGQTPNTIILLHNGELIASGSVIEVTEPGIHTFSAMRTNPGTLPTPRLTGSGTGGFLLSLTATVTPVQAAGVQIQGPLNPEGLSQTLARQQIFVCYPDSAAEEASCARQILANLADKAYRGWATEEDVDLLMAYYENGYSEVDVRAEDATDFERGIERALMAMLVDPKFLYRVSQSPENVVAGQSYPLSDLELASRLSFFLWREGPDAELVNLALEGRLSDTEVLQAQVARLLEDSRAHSLVTDFAFRWLSMSRLDEDKPDVRLYSNSSDIILGLMKQEMELFLSNIFFSDAPLTELLSADYTYLNQQLADFYGVQGVSGGHFQRVDLNENEERWGLLGKGAILVLTSFPNRTAPVIRGDYIMAHILGTPPSPPPPGVETNLENAVLAGTSVRAQLEAHRNNPACYACHAVIDGIGLTLENFDATGEWRDRDRHARLPLDTLGAAPDGTPLAGVTELRLALEARADMMIQTLTENLLVYSLGRLLEPEDMPLVRSIVRETVESGYRFDALIEAVVLSDAFRLRQVPAETEALTVASAGR